MTSLLSSALFAALVAAQVAVPPLKARVTDLTGTLNEQQRSALEHTLAEFESRKGSQIAVLLVPTTRPDTPVEYGVRVFDAWKLGRKGVDDGALLLVAKEDRRVWITTGRGLEGVLPDAIVKRIVDEEITPRFRQGDFYGGVRAGTDRMMRLIEGEKLPPVSAHVVTRGGQRSSLDFSQWAIIAFFIAAIGGPIARRIFGRLPGAGLIGGGLGTFAWLVAGSIAFSLVVGVIGFFISLLVGLGGGRGGGWSSGGWGGGGFGGGGFGGGGFGGGGGGFSGGGGSTAGGGAGGSW